MNSWLIKLTEEDTRILIAVFILVLLIFVIISYVGSLIRSVMKFQAKDLDTSMHDLISTGVVDNPRYFRRIAVKKNNRLLYKHMRVPFLLLFLSIGFLVIYLIWIGNFDLSFLFDAQTKGITTLFFTFEGQGVKTVTLEVRTKNTSAIRLYDKFGFSPKLIKKAYYDNGDDAVYMEKGLDL